ncbi:hypothetical protein OH76DRAFT_1561574 [Lentinus brumalis]|uniref:Uncharacterized protein n=1 Tax=Lentinus brumalis TaxID=2498619 RepID=A0A371CMC7_9APHY|nr:hypothetical protein OH76DRAFT_1561574 [Polyporus brumalis]
MAPKTKRPERAWNDESPQTPQKNKKARTVYPEYTQADVDRLPQDRLKDLVELRIQPEYAVPALLDFLHEHTGTIVHVGVNGERLDAILQDERFMDCWKKRREPGKMVEIMNHPIIRAGKNPNINPSPYNDQPRGVYDKEAAVKSWNCDYVGPAAQVLIQTIRREMTLKKNPYAHFAAFTQSSGTGKSRAVDELAKEVLCIPVTFGPLPKGGYPPMDLDAQLCLLAYDTRESFVKTVQAFLYAIFSEARDVVKDTILPQVKPDDPDRVKQITQLFREEMIRGMVFDVHGEFRKRFYRDVRTKAEKFVMTCDELPDDKSLTRKFAVKAENSDRLETVYHAAKAFLEVLYPEGNTYQVKKPCVILCFDEARSLTTIEQDGWSRFEELRRALRIIVELPIFSLFLSTKGKLEQFAPLPKKSGSRIASGNLSMYAPIVATPLDVLADTFPIYSKRPWTLMRAASTYHMAHLGRPLFAAMYEQSSFEFKRTIVDYAAGKLLDLRREDRPEPSKLSYVQKLALIAVRLPFNFRAVSPESVDDEWRQVSNHLRLVLYADVGFAKVVTASASEPLLAEASCSYTTPYRWQNPPEYRFDFYSTLAQHVNSSQLDLGTRGEMLGTMITLDARDRAASLYTRRTGRSVDLGEDGAGRLTAVGEFLRSLIPEEYHEVCLDGLPAAYLEGEENTLLRDAFAEGRTYFNHYVKVVSFEDVSQEMLLLALTRGAAFVCADGQDEFDLVIPVLMGDKLERSKVTAIFIRVRNSSRFGRKLHAPLFACIDPRSGEHPFFPEGVEKPPPIIRMVFALAAPSEQSSVSVRKQPKRSESRPPQKPGFTAYDLWFSGASRKTFGVIQSEDEEKSIATILSTMRDQRDVIHWYTEKKYVQAAVRQMQPLASTENDHADNWVDYTPDSDASFYADDHESTVTAVEVRPARDSEDEDTGSEDNEE